MCAWGEVQLKIGFEQAFLEEVARAADTLPSTPSKKTAPEEEDGEDGEMVLTAEEAQKVRILAKPDEY